MTKANGLDRALVHGLHLRMAKRPEPISAVALGAVLRVAQAYSQGDRDNEPPRDVIAEFDEDSLALVDILALAVVQLKELDGVFNFERDAVGEDTRRLDAG